MKCFKKGIIIKPVPSITHPIILYNFFINAIKALIDFLSSSAIGLYKQKLIAELIPNSETFNICKTEVNRLVKPTYSAPSL